jgi:serine/threonine protein kinase/tetratricopeptide (TPR) repeat protein
MTPELWLKIKSIVEQVEAAPLAERQGLLDTLCKADPELRPQVEEILAETVEDSFIGAAIREQAVSFGEGAASPERFGHYRIQRRIGKGGMGSVYEAVRTGDFHKRVALKVIRREIDSAAARERFQQERQTLAGLEHPYIARLLDGGESNDGSPYLVLEYVDGQPIDIYSAALDRTEKLRLFLKVCEAVEYAHRNLVVHRDLKPANILVTNEGDPKLLDFGIAKLLAPDASATQTGMSALTPDYASPEQVRGQPISTASDVYSLGIILYNLLTGRKPYAFQTPSRLEMDRVVCTVEPEPPGLGDELDHILMMALRKEPERRYSGVQRFAEDIERYLDHRPVLARPDTFGYRAAKFIRRNWWQITAVTAVILSLSAGLGFSIVQQRRATRRFNQVRQLANQFLFDFHDEIVKTPGTVKARQMIVSTAQQYLNSLAADAAGDPGLQWELAVAYTKVAAAQGSTTSPSLGLTRDAIASYEKALALARPLAAKKRLNETQRIGFERMLRDDASTVRSLTDYERALKLGHEAVEASEGLPAAEQRNALSDLANTMGRAGDLPGSVSNWKRIVSLEREEARKDPSFKNRLWLGHSLANLGYFQAKLTDLEQARINGEESIAVLTAMAPAYPGNLQLTGERFLANYFYGLTQGAKERPSLNNEEGAMKAFREALSIVDGLIAADPHDNQSRTNAGLLYTIMEITKVETAPREALRYAAQARAYLDPIAQNNPAMQVVPRIWAAEAHRRLGQFADAEENLNQAAKIKGDSPDNQGDLQLEYALLEQVRGKMDASAAWFDRSIASDEVNMGLPTPANAFTLTIALDRAAKAFPSTSKARRERILAVWQDQNKRYPGIAYIERKVAEAQASYIAADRR